MPLDGGDCTEALGQHLRSTFESNFERLRGIMSEADSLISQHLTNLHEQELEQRLKEVTAKLKSNSGGKAVTFVEGDRLNSS